MRRQLFEKMRSNNASFKDCAEQKEIDTKDHSKLRSIHDIQKRLNHASNRLGKKGRSKSDKSSPAAEKIWDGFLQLNSSRTMPAVAFFTSGEKLPDINWSEFVEVKGKVRLEDFEKYVQELPRSRSRGLMVISICCNKVTEKVIKQMKEVAKGYIKGERVGYAELSPGVALYICPRTDAIITKHRFFKGMAAIESMPDFFIGCVVWRGNYISLASVAKMSEKKTYTLSNSIHAVAVGKSCLSSADDVKELASAKSCSIDNKSSSIISQQISPSLKGTSSEQQEVVRSKCYAKADRENVEHPTYNRSLRTNTLYQKKPSFEIDDLPEFEFGTASGKSITTIDGGFGKSTQFSAYSVPVSKIPFADSGKKTNLLDDDDDMPECLPPYPKKRLLAKEIDFPAKVPLPEDQGFKNMPFHHHPPRAFSSFPTPAPNPPNISSLPYSHVLHTPFSSTVPPPVPSQYGSSNMAQFTFNPVLHPTSGPSAVKSNNLQPADGFWRP